MKIFIFITLILLILIGQLKGQDTAKDSIHRINLNEVIISANKYPQLLKSNPGSVSLVTQEMLLLVPKSIGAEEALRLVPGVRIDNQHDGERVHISIRGQGILTERGLRGIGVLIDGIPVNDPSGFAPDVYDVDWAAIKNIEVLRGPETGIYGSGGAAGVLSITTLVGNTKPFGGELSQIFGSNGFMKSLLQIDGSKNDIDYRLGYSYSKGNGYRDHQAFWSNKMYEKVNFHPSKKLAITQVISHIDYFQQNPEGLNLGQFENLKQANPDANPFNEYQKTNRTTIGINGTYLFNYKHDIEATAYLRSWNYKETSNKCAEYRTITNPGAGLQYNLHLNVGKLKNSFSLSADAKWQDIEMYKLQSGSNPDRVENSDETNIETDSLMANQIIAQQSFGFFGIYKIEFEKFSLVANVRYDYMNNELTNKMVASDTAKTNKEYSNTSFKLGASYGFVDLITLFASWSQGFMPPSTEELANNPTGYSGFNTHLVPATSNCYDIGLRGFWNEKFAYDVIGFLMYTQNDFFRFKQSGRGNQEVFYGNAGNSTRYGIEAFISLKILQKLNLQIAYTYAHYTYTSADVDPVYTDTSFVLTTPPSTGQWLPNSPRHQLYAELKYKITRNFIFTFSTEYQSKWAIYTDSKAYHGELDPTIYQNWQDGFNLYHARLSYEWQLWKLNGELSLALRNLTKKEYMAFTEPDPDGNSYHPGPGREFFGALKIGF